VQPYVVPDSDTEKRLKRWHLWTNQCTGLAAFATWIIFLYFMEISSILDLLKPEVVVGWLGIIAIQLLAGWLIMLRATRGLDRVSDLSTFAYFADHHAKKRHPQELVLVTICSSFGSALCFMMSAMLIIFQVSVAGGLIFLFIAVISTVFAALFGRALSIDPGRDD
jgi:hypothetical protein